MTILLANSNHCMLAGWNILLSNRPVTAYITWIHARIIWRLQSTFIAGTFLKLTCTVSARCNRTQIIQLRRRPITNNCLRVTQKFISYTKLKRCLLLNRWGVKHLRKGEKRKNLIVGAANGVYKHSRKFENVQIPSQMR